MLGAASTPELYVLEKETAVLGAVSTPELYALEKETAVREPVCTLTLPVARDERVS